MINNNGLLGFQGANNKMRSQSCCKYLIMVCTGEVVTSICCFTVQINLCLAGRVAQLGTNRTRSLGDRGCFSAHPPPESVKQ